ncbi:hypothetical protein BWK59_13935 [Flavobacterium davisii]|uniref:Uncharacterized protein n=1 Tax=Flavobacterium davisii TaxID=2906077 RepID=A0A246GF91_9FLAO|nr:hypothetical protein BWK59_13935 [Flavobacterium davisii]
MASINKTIKQVLRSYNPIKSKSFEINLNISKYRLSLSLLFSIDKCVKTSKANANNLSEHSCNQEHFENRLLEYFQAQNGNAKV